MTVFGDQNAGTYPICSIDCPLIPFRFQNNHHDLRFDPTCCDKVQVFRFNLGKQLSTWAPWAPWAPVLSGKQRGYIFKNWKQSRSLFKL